MPDDQKKLIEALRTAGFSRAAIEAAWPPWWTDEADSTASGRAELRFALARRLGLQPKSLLGERVEFLWNDEARFKHLSAEDESQKAALTSFGMSVGRLVLSAAPGGASARIAADVLHRAVLGSNAFVDLPTLVATCWALGIPIIYLRVFPLESKSMHAMVVELDGRFAVLLGRDSSYPAPVAFTLAHELGHAMLGHLGGAAAIVDLKDPATSRDHDQQEDEADRYALELLTGSPEPKIETNLPSFNAPTLAAAVLSAAGVYRIEPGTLALCLGYQRGAWPVAMSALKFIYRAPMPAWREVNRIAERELDWTSISDDGEAYLRGVMGLANA